MKSILHFAAPLALIAAPAPLLAQDAGDETAEATEEGEVFSEDMLAGVMGALAGMFATEPLSAEEEARLPAATALVDKIVPDGTIGEMMSGMFDGMLGPIMEMGEEDAKGPLAKLLGVPYLPITPTFPLLGPLGLVPLPSKWMLEFGEPIRTDTYDEGAAEDPMLVFNVTDQVRETIQHTLFDLLRDRGGAFG